VGLTGEVGGEGEGGLGGERLGEPLDTGGEEIGDSLGGVLS